MKKQSIDTIWLLVPGVILMAAAHLTYHIEILAWVSSVPFMLYLSRTRGFWSRFNFMMALLIAWSICVLKIVTDPIPLYMIPLYSIPLTLVQIPGYLVWAKFRKRNYSLMLFPAVMVIMEWLQYTFSPFGSWGAIAYTQTNNIILKQSVSLFGLAGLGFLIYLVNSLIAEMIEHKHFLPGKLVPVTMVLLGFLIYGSIRLDIYQSRSREEIKVAAVGTDSEVSGIPIPDRLIRDEHKDILMDRTRSAAASGAEIVAWNEAAAIVLPEEETEWLENLSSLAGELGIHLVASYVVLISESPFRFENKYVMFTSDGLKAATYHKHEPVPGEPAVRGTEVIRSVDMGRIRLGGAICYDYDFPYLAAEFGHANADIVALPSSDWRGIDPIHTDMAAFRAVEQGYSILRSTRAGLSAAIDPAGVLVARMSSFDRNDRMMIAQLPIDPSRTLYSIIGDLWVYLCIAYVVFFLLAVSGLFRFKPFMLKNSAGQPGWMTR